LSAEEAQALVAPHTDTLELVDAWLTHCDVDPSSVHRSGGKDWITVRVSVAQAERMLGKAVYCLVFSFFSNISYTQGPNITSTAIPRHPKTSFVR